MVEGMAIVNKYDPLCKQVSVESCKLIDVLKVAKLWTNRKNVNMIRIEN